MEPLVQVNNTLPWALLIHLCFTCWFLGTESLQSEIATDSISEARDYASVIASYEDRYGVLVSRRAREGNESPLTLLVFVTQRNDAFSQGRLHSNTTSRFYATVSCTHARATLPHETSSPREKKKP